MRSTLATTASALNGVPSWNVTPSRSVNCQVVSSTWVGSSVARPGSELAVGVAGQQRLVDVVVDGALAAVVDDVRVEAGRLGAEGDRDRRTVGGRAGVVGCATAIRHSVARCRGVAGAVVESPPGASVVPESASSSSPPHAARTAVEGDDGTQETVTLDQDGFLPRNHASGAHEYFIQ